MGISAGPYQGVNLFWVGVAGNNHQAMAQLFGAQLVKSRSTEHSGHVQIDQHHVKTVTRTQFIYQASVGIASLNHHIWKNFFDKKCRNVAKRGGHRP